ncbi:hypothetical protein SBOR_4523 [Sclerotinia borealis F-4128]|uniref:Uncharacterized protein n=1 Tax=Sclerotinia borealis (strain F-4128) TaxID=1432307 RepID=W9CGJ2_SCLBF|nr:hypothetical protein SBOR_4523 [Sclerotinia borealis F-4128]
MSHLSIPSKRGGSPKEEPYYTDDDLVILHDIVVFAQEVLPTLIPKERLPTSALFRSYYKILPRVGIDTDHDSRLAKLLSKIGNLRDFNGTLFERFEEVLAQKGITLEFDTDTHEHLRSRKGASPEVADNKESDTLYNDENEPPLPRRNSESGVLDLENAAEAQADEQKHKRNMSFPPLPFGPVAPAKINELKSFISEATRAITTELIPVPTPEPPRTTQKGRQERGVKNVENWLQASEDGPPRRRDRSVSTHSSIRTINRQPESVIQRGRPSGQILLHNITNERQDTSDELTTTSEAGEQDANAYLHPKVLPKLCGWIARARLHIAARRAELEARAVKYDTGALTQQAFSSWTEKFRERQLLRRQLSNAKELAEHARQVHLTAQRRLRESEARCTRLEKRVDEYRRGHLRVKAISHWAETAREKVGVTTVATKYLTVNRNYRNWKVIAEEKDKKIEVNNEEARKFQLGKFLGKWRAKKEESDAKSNMAAQRVSQKNEQRALSKWFKKAQVVKKANELIGDERLLSVVSESMDTWRDKTQKKVGLNEEAERANKTKKLANAMQKWRREVGHAQQERRATEIDRANILGDATKIWRYQTKLKKQQAISDERAVAEAFQTWELETKLVTFQKKKSEEVKSACLEVFFDRVQDSRSRRWEREEIARRHDNKNVAADVLRQWYMKMDHRAEVEAQAEEFQAPLILGRCLDSLREQALRTAKLEKMASRARSFLLATVAMKSWREATARSKREKRKVAYALVRRNRKVCIGKDMLSRWRGKAREKMELCEQALQSANNKAIIIGMDLFDHWRARNKQMVELNTLWEEMVMKKFFNMWKGRTGALQALSIEATLDFQDRRQTKSVRNWSLRAMQVKSMKNTAKEVHDKTTRKRHRNIYNYWYERTIQQRPIVDIGTPPGTFTAENWSDFGEEVDMDEITKRLYARDPPRRATVSLKPSFDPLTPKPGYMATPSRRSQLLAASARYHSTTPRAPLTTPLERQLRTGIYGTSMPNSKRGRSTLGMGAGFEDIPERYMRAVLPGKAQAKLQAVCTGYWDSRRLIAYITGNAFVILTGADTIVQTIYDDDDTQLEAIALDESSGKIATCAGSNIRIYKPYGQDEGALKWSLQHSISIDESGHDTASTLSWGISEELLVGSSWFTLFSTIDAPVVVWKQQLANPIKFANFSYDSAFIAASGKYDRFVKIWRRLSFGNDDTRFDFTYLPHPRTVTNMHWRRPFHVDQTIDNVLYTVCADNVLSIWTPTDVHSLQSLQLWGQINLQESIQPRGLDEGKVSKLRFAFVIDGRDFTFATEHAVQERAASDSKEDHSLAHLIEVANRNPEICVVLDEHGHLSAWGLENVGSKIRQSTNIFNIAHVDGLELGLPTDLTDDTSYVQLYNFCNQSGGNLNVLVHHFDGKIEFFEADVANLFDPSPRSRRLKSKALWTGHSAAIKKIVRNVSGRAVVSRTDGNESIVWKHMEHAGGTSVFRQSIISQSEHVHRICVMRKGNFVIYLHHEHITLWDTRHSAAVKLADCKFYVMGKPLCILMLPELNKEGPVAHVATITSKMKGIVWEVMLPQRRGSIQVNGYQEASIREFCQFDLGDDDDLAYVLPVDPAGSPPVISGFLDTFARDIAISYTHSGLLRSWAARIDPEKEKVDWLQTCSVDTGISEPALASGSSIRKAALVNSSRSELTIWDVRGAQLEYSQDYESQDTIQDLDWTSTPDDQSILAVGFRYRVVLLAQMRYDYLNKGPAWAAIREVNIRDLTPHPIGDSTWLGGGNFIVGAGNQLFVYDKEVDSSAATVLPPRKTSWDLFDAVSRLNGPLPVYHPQFLSQYILAGKNLLVQHILLALYKILKYYIEGEAIDSHLGMNIEDFYVNSEMAPSANKGVKSTFDGISGDDEVETVTEDVAAAITEKLTQIALPQLSRHEQIHLADIVECVAIVERQRRSMDDNAARFMLFFRQHVLRRGRANELALSWREINWAYHSHSQDILADMISRQFHGRMLWEHARESGIFMWMTDANALKTQFETIARNEYTKSDLKNPIDCSLYYLALKKKAVLQGLWRMAAWNREQGATIRLLANNFSEKKWRTAAMKNAYALLGKRRFEYAAAFFLLADCLKDAVNVILTQLKDLQLAITITRVYEGEHGPVLKELLEEKVLPLAAQEGNRWLASWAFWMLHRRDMASPVYTLLETPQSPDLQAKLFLTDDPALVVLYSQLRQKTLQTLRGASKVTPKVEWAFVLHNSRLYDRMGCDLLALDLVRNWEFLLPTKPDFTGFDGEINPRKMLRRRSSLVVADLPVSGIGPAAADKKDATTGHGQTHKPPPTVFEEPEVNSLLDSFGF